MSDLITDIVDIIVGCEIMQDRAEPDLRPVVDRQHSLHDIHPDTLRERLVTMGGNPDDTGSLMGSMHTAVATARDWFGTPDGSALDQIIDGEERPVDSDNTVIGAAQGNAGLARLLEGQRSAVRSAIGDLRG